MPKVDISLKVRSNSLYQFPSSPPAPGRTVKKAEEIRIQSKNTPQLSHAPMVESGISLVPTDELPDRFRAIFNFPLFNAVQSKSFPALFHTDDNIVLSSPTGSGKTAIMELAICRLINNHGPGTFKIVYQAPTKALCSERQRDWERKFGILGLKVTELTGDTDYQQLANVKNGDLIITTPEKWDSMTRRWHDHKKLLEMVRLFLVGAHAAHNAWDVIDLFFRLMKYIY